MTNLYTSLEQRLQAIANGDYEDAKQHSNSNRCAILCLNLFYSKSGQLLGWYKPQLIILEPSDINPLLIAECEQVQDWQQVIDWLSENRRDRSLIIRHGKPLAWLP